MNVYLVARMSCSDAAMTFKQEANISRLNLNQSSWADRRPMICSLLIAKGGRKVRVIQNALIPLESVFNCCELEHAYLDR